MVYKPYPINNDTVTVKYGEYNEKNVITNRNIHIQVPGGRQLFYFQMFHFFN